MTRRALAGGGVAGYHEWFGPHAHIPPAPQGWIRLEQVHSQARGGTVDLFTAVPHGHGDGAHTRAYWHSVTLPASAFLGAALGRTAT